MSFYLLAVQIATWSLLDLHVNYKAPRYGLSLLCLRFNDVYEYMITQVNLFMCAWLRVHDYLVSELSMYSYAYVCVCVQVYICMCCVNLLMSV